ncbi:MULTISPECIES: hypothetical protein [Dermacoccus]|nr:hypothetical protein [Dermacoccus nishinomiyaensis]
MSEMPQLPPGLRNNVLSLRYLLLGFLLSWLPLPASGLAAIPLALSLFYGIRYLRDVRRAGVAGAFGPNLVGLVLTALLLVMTAAPLVHYERTKSYQECLWGANTNQARESCESSYSQNPNEVEKFFFN